MHSLATFWRCIISAAIGIEMALVLLASPSSAPAQPTDEPSAPPTTDGAGDAAEAAPEEDDPSAEQERDEELPTRDEMELPTAEQLMRGPRVDWIVLKHDEQVVVTEPVTPRPNTLDKMQQAIDTKREQRGSLSGEQYQKYLEELDALSKIHVRLPDQVDEANYLLPMKLVETIIHHEDLVLRRVDELIRQDELNLAYELLNILLRRTPDWPGALNRHYALLLAEADRDVARQQYEAALATLEQIHSRSPQYAGLSQRMGQVARRLIEKAVANDGRRRARHYLRRLQEHYSGHPVVQQWRTRFVEEAEEQLAAAAEARSDGHHRLALTHAERAAHIWPALRNLRARYRPFAERYQRLHIGVLDLPGDRDEGAVIKSPAAQRAERLRMLRLFQVDEADDGTAHYRNRFCDRWEPLNLGREALFKLRSSRQPWEARPVVTAPLIAERIAARLDPTSSLYDERLAGYVRSVEVHSPFSFTVNFDRVPVRTEALLAIPVIEAADADSPAIAEGKAAPVSFTAASSPTGGFQLTERTDERAVYRRAIPQPDDQRLYHLNEIAEHHYADFDSSLQALMRGDVSMLVRPPPWIVDLLRRDEELLKSFFVEKMAVPMTHLVQFHPRSRILKNREYRRALAYAIDRDRILTETVLRGRGRDLGRVAGGPFPSKSEANNALVRTREYDPVAAVSLTLAARKQFGGELPPLRMIVIGDPLAHEAAGRLIESWARFGIEVQIQKLPAGPLVERDGSESRWDLLYRTVQLTEPITQLWPFLTLTGRAQVSDLDPFPDWLRQEIIDLDMASDWRAALQAVKRLHLHLWGEVMLLPLWEVDQYLIYRKHVRGVPVSPVHPYEDADGWVIEAWYPEDEP